MNPRNLRIPNFLELPDGTLLAEEEEKDILPTKNIESLQPATTLYFFLRKEKLPNNIKATIWNTKINDLIIREQSLKEPLLQAKKNIEDGKILLDEFSSNKTSNDFLIDIDKFVEETNWQIISNRKSFLCYQFVGAALGVSIAIACIYSAPIGIGLCFLSVALGTLCGIGTVQLLARKNSYASFCLFKPPSELVNFADKLKENIPTKKMSNI